MNYRFLLAPIIGLALAGAAAAQTPTTPQPATPSNPSNPQPATPRVEPQPAQPTTQPQQPASQTPINPPSTPSSGMGQSDQQPAQAMRQGDMDHGPVHRMLQGHLDTALQGIQLSYSQYRRIDSTAMAAMMAEHGRMGGMGMAMRGGRDGRDGRSNNTNCGVAGQPGQSPNNMPGSTGGVNTNCPPNQSTTPGSATNPDTSRGSEQARSYPAPGQPGSQRDSMGMMPDRGQGGRGMRPDTLDATQRQRLSQVLEQIDTAIRPILTAAQQRTFDRNLATMRRNKATATN